MAAGIVCFLFLLSTGVDGTQLIWNQVTWTPRALTNSFDIDATNPGDDIRITITGDVDFLTGNNPQISDTVRGGFPAGTNSLELTSTFETIYQQWTLTCEFLYSGGASNVSFTIFDIDSITTPPPSDQLRNIYGIAAGTTNPVAPLIIGSADNSVTGTGIYQTVTGTSPNINDEPYGNVYISYSNVAISSFTYTMGMATNEGDVNRLRSMHNSLYNIFYTGNVVVPETGVGLAPAMLGGFALVLLALRKRRASTN